jgi:hypothetical protein
MMMSKSVRPMVLVTLALLLACSSESARIPSEAVTGLSAQRFSSERTPWSAPVRLNAPVNSPTANEQAPALSADGLSLYFCSNRTGSLGNDLWVARRVSEADPWGEPTNLGTVVNSAGGDCGPSLSVDGLLLFFTSNRGGGPNDIYLARRSDPADDLSWGAPVRLGFDVNTAAFEFSPFITKFACGDEDDDDDAEGDQVFENACVADLYFERGASNVATDIFVAKIDAQGNTLGPAVPVAEVNSSDGDGRPTVRFDGREMLLQSNRDGRGGNVDLFVSIRQNRHQPWSTPVPVDELNTSPMHEIHPYLSRDARTVFFVRGTGQANDIWMSVRTPSGH